MIREDGRLLDGARPPKVEREKVETALEKRERVTKMEVKPHVVGKREYEPSWERWPSKIIVYLLKE